MGSCKKIGRPYVRHYLMAAVQVDQDDASILAEGSWNVVCDRGRWYVQRMNRTTRRIEKLHRVLMAVTEPKVQVDHINGDGLDNRRCNLRLCDASQNQRNRGKTKSNTSGFKGVSWAKKEGKWQAQITYRKKAKHLGFYTSAEEAHEVYAAAALALHGEFANTGKVAGDPWYVKNGKVSSLQDGGELIPFEEAVALGLVT